MMRDIIFDEQAKRIFNKTLQLAYIFIARLLYTSICCTYTHNNEQFSSEYFYWNNAFFYLDLGPKIVNDSCSS